MNQNKISLPIPNSIQNDCSLKRLSKYYNLETKGTKNMRKFKNNKNDENSDCIEFYKQINLEYKENFTYDSTYDQLSSKKSEKGSIKNLNIQERKESKGSLSALSKYLDSKIKGNNTNENLNVNSNVNHTNNIENKNEKLDIAKENAIKLKNSENSNYLNLKNGSNRDSNDPIKFEEKINQKSSFNEPEINQNNIVTNENDIKVAMGKKISFDKLIKEKLDSCKNDPIVKIGPNSALNFLLQKYQSNLHIITDKVNIFKTIKTQDCERLKLSSLIKLTEKVSIYGLDVNYVSINNNSTKNKTLETTNYLPALSIIKLCFKIDDSIKDFIKDLPNNKIVVKNDVYMNEGFYFFQNGAFLQIVDNEAVFFYADQKGFHSRKPFCLELEGIVPKEILEISLTKFQEDSCFGILWSPNVSYNEGISTQFIAYYHLKYDEKLFETNNNLDFDKIYSNHFTNNNKKSTDIFYLNLIGILPIKFDNNYFLKSLHDNVVNNENIIFLNKCIVSKI